MMYCTRVSGILASERRIGRMQKISKVTKMDLGAIRDNPAMSISVQEKDIESCLRAIKQYGAVSPPIVRSSNGDYMLISGQCELTAMRRHGVKSSEVVVIETEGDTDANKLALLLSSLRKANSPLTEGLILKDLLANKELSQAQIALLTGKSISWVSRRINLVSRLEDSVLQLVSRGQICGRTAQEIAKLPPRIQHKFAVKVIDATLPKSLVEKLVATYNCSDTSNSFKEHILNEPKDAIRRIGSKVKQIRKVPRKPNFSSPQIRLHSGLRLLIELLAELEELFCQMESAELKSLGSILEAVPHSMMRFMRVSMGPIEAFAPGQIEMFGGKYIADQYGAISTNQTTVPD
jgi:ParB/RepB/Spo0J family partition protein